MSKRGQQLSLLALVILCSFTVMQYISVRAFDQERVPRVHLLIQQILAADIQIEQDMMQIYNRSLLHYDTLTSQSSLQTALFQRLSTTLTTSGLTDQLVALEQSINIQHEAIDDFKSSIGILVNSERYLPELAEQLTAEHPAQAAILHEISLNMMRWIAIPDTVQKDVIQQKISAIKKFGFPILARHANLVFTRLEDSRDAIDRAVNCGTPENAHILLQKFDDIEATKTQQYYQQRTWLVNLVLLLIVGLAWLAWRHYRDALRILSDSQMQQGLNKLLTIAIAEEILSERLQQGLAAIMAQKWLGTEARGALFLINKEQLEIAASTHLGNLSSICDIVPLTECLCCTTALSEQATSTSQAPCQHSCPLTDMADHTHYSIPLSVDKRAVGLLNIYLPKTQQLSDAEHTFLNSSSNILAQMVAKHAAQATMQKLELAIEQIPDAIFITDPQGIVIYANPQCERVYDIPLSSICGSPAARLRGGQLGDAMYQKIISTMHAGKSWKGEITLTDTQQSQRVMRRIVAPMMEANKVRWHVCVDHDITIERTIQNKSEHSQRLESLGVLAGGIAHDFNNLLTAIMGNAAMAELRALKKPQDTQRYLSNIVSSSEKAAELCKQMLAYAGVGSFILKTIDLSVMAQEISTLLQVSIGKGVLLKYHLTENLPTVQGDVAQIQQIIMNLVTNASDAIGDKHGVISISTGLIEADHAYLLSTSLDDHLPTGQYVFLEISDTGCGMDKATQARLFEPFFSTKSTGHGLGMSAALGIIRSHQGAIKLYSEPGKGSCFKVLFPTSEKSEPLATVAPAASDTCGGGTILVVDDDEAIRETAAMMLEAIGFKTMLAVDGLDAIAVYNKHQDKILAVLLDMTMPKMDGKSCFTELKRINPEVKVVLSSGYNEQEATDRFAGQGLAGFIQKPYLPDALKTTMRQALCMAA
ncbi:MAG: ATP-binding protein [Mariprofundus sp.]|nr:ATP-binding protein [Mariprofundus sp.]